MEIELKKKAYLGVGRFMIPLPLFLLKSEITKSANTICKATAHLSDEERMVHRFVVNTITDTNQDVSLEKIASNLDIPLERIKEIVEKLEDLKVFFYRYKSQEINWAYPVTTESSEYKLNFSSGESCTAAWAADAVANPFVQGRLRNKELSMTINTVCANSGKPIRIEFDNNLILKYLEQGADPMICIPKINLVKVKQTSIVDIFWRKSLFFWSEEDAKQYQKKTRESITIYLSLLQSVEANKVVQAVLFPW